MNTHPFIYLFFRAIDVWEVFSSFSTRTSAAVDMCSQVSWGPCGRVSLGHVQECDCWMVRSLCPSSLDPSHLPSYSASSLFPLHLDFCFPEVLMGRALSPPRGYMGKASFFSGWEESAMALVQGPQHFVTSSLAPLMTSSMSAQSPGSSQALHQLQRARWTE